MTDNIWEPQLSMPVIMGILSLTPFSSKEASLHFPGALHTCSNYWMLPFFGVCYEYNVKHKNKAELLKQASMFKGMGVYLNDHLTKKTAEIARKARNLKKKNKIPATLRLKN